MKLTGGQIVVESLKREGVDVMFGYPGGAVIALYDAFYDSDIRNILVRHEQGAGHAADGYARATGKVGVCIATSGPGATNLATALATAYMDSIPIVAITGQVSTGMIGNDAFQETDATGITRSITKYNFLVKDINNLARIIKTAFYIARSGRPGPVLIDLPTNITKSKTEFIYPETIEIRGYKPTYKGHNLQIKRAAAAINAAVQPVLYVGGGAILSNASKEIRELAHKANLPITTTLMGIGIFPEDDPLALKMLGMHGSWYANWAINHSDLIIAVGARFDDRVTGDVNKFAPNAKIIHIDIDPTSISKSIKVDIPIVGDVKAVVTELNQFIEYRERKDWFDLVFKWKEEHPLIYDWSDDVIKPQYVIEQIYDITKGKDLIISTEVGQNQMWAAQFFTYKYARQLLTSGGLGTMGYGFPAAIGAKAGMPEKTVIDIAGDGSIQMNIQELATAVENCIDVKIFILNNGYLGLVRQWQQLFYGNRTSSTCIRRSLRCPDKCAGPGPQCPEYLPDFVALAEAYAATGIRVEKPQDVRSAIEKALKTKGVVIVDFIVAPEENVFPMIPSGGSAKEMLTHELV